MVNINILAQIPYSHWAERSSLCHLFLISSPPFTPMGEGSGVWHMLSKILAAWNEHFPGEPSACQFYLEPSLPIPNKPRLTIADVTFIPLKNQPYLGWVGIKWYNQWFWWIASCETFFPHNSGKSSNFLMMSFSFPPKPSRVALSLSFSGYNYGQKIFLMK